MVKFTLRNSFFLPIVLFSLSFFYIFNMTIGVNPNWESDLFIESMAGVPFVASLVDTFKIGGMYVTASHGPFNSIYYKTLFFLFGYNFFFYRLAKALFFSGAITVFYLLCSKFLSKKYAIASSLFVLFSFPLFIQTLVFDEGFIISEFFKLLALYLFFIDVNKEKSSIISRFLILFFSILAIRTHTTAYAISAIFIFYLLILHRNKIKEYWWLVLYIILTKLPLDFQFGFVDSSYGFKTDIVNSILFSDFLRYIVSPFPYFINLYYRPLVSIITFFGFWLFVLFVILFLLRNWLGNKQTFSSFFNKTEFSPFKKDTLIFLLIWTLCEVPIFFLLPEPAIRYSAGIIMPLSGIFFIFFQETETIINFNKQKIIALFFILFSLAVITNVAYAVLFRATWGSSFIGMDKVSSYIMDNDLEKDKNAILYYYASSVAPEYYIVDEESKDEFRVSMRLVPVVMDIRKISPDYFKEQKNEETEIYIVKRVSSFGNSRYPDIDFETFSYLERINIIEGRSNNLFDVAFNFLTSLFKISYSPNLFYVYRLNENNSSQ